MKPRILPVAFCDGSRVCDLWPATILNVDMPGECIWHLASVDGNILAMTMNVLLMDETDPLWHLSAERWRISRFFSWYTSRVRHTAGFKCFYHNQNWQSSHHPIRNDNKTVFWPMPNQNTCLISYQHKWAEQTLKDDWSWTMDNGFQLT